MTAESHTPDADLCPECGALVGAGVRKCWLCGWQRDGAQASIPPVMVVPRVVPHPADRRFSYSLESLLLLVTLVAVGLGAIVNFPGIGIIVAIVMAPAFVRTAMVVRQRDRRGKPVALWQRVALFLGSFVTAMVIITVVAVASVGTFCAVCLGSYDTVGEAAWPLAILSAGVTTVAAIVFAVWWIRRRWRRDTQIK